MSIKNGFRGEKMNKKIIICCDGTWNKPEDDKPGRVPTNVLKLVRAIQPTDSGGNNQIVYYDQGIGTGGFFDKYIGGATGKGISGNIKEAYRFLANNFNEGDEIYCFGFSRGAYSVRSLGGLISTIGILPKSDLDKLTMAYNYYKKHPDKRKKYKYYDEIKELMKNTIKVRIKFMGVWDTVGALGAPTPLLGWLTRKLWVRFHDTTSRNIDYAYHALAIDERRGPFAPGIWTQCDDCKEMKQVWFSGAHSNIGGGYKDAGLSDLTFDWMLKMAENCGLEFNPEYLERKVNANHKGKVINSFSLFYTFSQILYLPYYVLRLFYLLYKFLRIKNLIFKLFRIKEVPFKLFRFKNVPRYLRTVGGKHRDVDGYVEGMKEMIHQSVVDRYKSNMPTFNPKNLKHGIEHLPVEP
jgi:uncharacterized protein (DUF2235 family)